MDIRKEIIYYVKYKDKYYAKRNDEWWFDSTSDNICKNEIYNMRRIQRWENIIDELNINFNRLQKLERILK